MHSELVCHPDTPAAGQGTSVTVQVQRWQDRLQLLYLVQCEPDRIAMPAPQRPYRADDLWRTTCFELFLADQSGAYREFNFSPSSQWAAYSFEKYREGREQLAQNEPPESRLLSPEPFGIMLLASVVIEPDATGLLGLSAVIEETEGTKSYWALAHPPGAPDFHHRDCFALELAPARPA